jgi:hypothetical protein
VEEILVADPATREVALFQRGSGRFERTNISAVLEAPVENIAARITWP